MNANVEYNYSDSFYRYFILFIFIIFYIYLKFVNKKPDCFIMLILILISRGCMIANYKPFIINFFPKKCEMTIAVTIVPFQIILSY